MDYKLRNVARTLKSWSMSNIGSVRLQLAIAREVILRLDCVQEQRSLSPEEIALRKEMKWPRPQHPSQERLLGNAPE